jgi:hypothetical protein
MSSTAKDPADIHLEIVLTLLQSLTGFKRTISIKHLDLKAPPKLLRIEKTGVTKHGAEDVYPNLGKLKGGEPEEGEDERGRLIVRYVVGFPDLDEKQRRELRETL